MHVDGCEKKLFCKDEFVYYAPCLDLTQDKITADSIQRYPLVTHSPDYFMTNALEDYFVKLKYSHILMLDYLHHTLSFIIVSIIK